MSALPPLATIEALGAWLDATIAEDDARAAAVLDAVSALVRSEAGRTWANEADIIPDDVATVVVQVAARVYRNPLNVAQESTGPFSVRYADASGLHLTAIEKAIIGRYRAQPRGLWSMGTTRNDPVADTIYVPVVGTDTPFPFLSSDDEP